MSRYVAGIQVRFADLDPRGHVNNVAYATYLEQTRAGWVDDVVETDLVEIDMVLARIEIDFERPIGLGDDVEVALDVTGLGESSIHLDYEIVADGEVAATAKTVQVIVDADSGRARAIPEAMREAVAEYHGIEG